MVENVETLIIGGGQGGLATTYYLTQLGREHVILDAAEAAAQPWRQERWDSFTLVTPNWSFRLPGADYDGPDPDGFMPRREVVERLEGYIERYRLPVQFGVRAVSVEPEDSGYRVETSRGAWKARNVVVATGIYQKPKVPAWSREIPPSIFQLTSAGYRNPEALPPGPVLVAGSAQSGCQIAEELLQAGREVYLCTGTAGRAPRRYRGRDTFEWLVLSGYFARTKEQLPSSQARFAGNPQVSGKDGGHTLDLHKFYQDGMVLLGHVRGFQDGNLLLAGDLKANLARVDGTEAQIVRMIDGYIAREGIDAPEDRLPNRQDGYAAPDPLTLDLAGAGISTIIWASGFSFDFSMVRAPVFDEAGFPQAPHGISASPGLYFAGLPWLPGQNTGIFLGVGGNATAVAEHIRNRMQ